MGLEAAPPAQGSTHTPIDQLRATRRPAMFRLAELLHVLLVSYFATQVGPHLPSAAGALE
jgi:hypothetical protein